MTEAELLAEVTRLCEKLGLLWHHCSDSRSCHGTPGFPDLVIVGVRRVIFAELKGENGEINGSQQLWLFHIARMGLLSQVIWLPDDWRSGTIEETLRAIA